MSHGVGYFGSSKSSNLPTVISNARVSGPCGLFALLCFIIGWPNKTKAYDAVRRSFSEFDYPGSFLLLAASVLVVFGLQEAGTGSYTWDSSVVLSTLIVGCICWVLLFIWEYVIAKRNYRIAAMYPFGLFTHRPMLGGILSTLLTGFVFFLVIISLPLRFQIVNLKSPAAAGVNVLPLLCACGVGSFLGGAVSSKKNYTFHTFITASCLITLGTGLLSTLGSSISIESKCYGFQVILGLGVGLTVSSISLMTSIETDFRTHAVAQGIVAQIRVLGGSIGVAASNAIFNATCAKNLKGILTPEQIKDLQINTQVVNTLDETGRQAVRVAFSDAFHHSLRICLYIAVVCLFVSACTWQKNPPLRSKSGKDPSAEKK